MEGHIVRTFDGEILNLRIRALQMGGYVLDQVQRAVQALGDNDAESAANVIARHVVVVEYARGIEDETVALIARRQPVASDLTTILGVARVATDLERVGNAARKIARIAIQLRASAEDMPPQRFYHDVRRMARVATGMLREALDCYDRLDVAGAAGVIGKDAEIDGEVQLALRELLTFVMEDPRRIGDMIHTVFALKAIERVGDHARNIAGLVSRLASREHMEAPSAGVTG
jgi:phosphate transport system protein